MLKCKQNKYEQMGVRGAHDGRRRTVITIARYENFVLRGAKKWGMIKRERSGMLQNRTKEMYS